MLSKPASPVQAKLFVQKLEACTFRYLDALNHNCFNMGQSTLHINFETRDTTIEVEGI